MAVMRPELSEQRLDELASQPKTRAEAKFYRACRERLPDRVVVHYSVHMLNNRMVEGEADFVVLDPRCGMVVVEVKGGGVRFDSATGVWTSVGWDHNEHIIRDPFRQASSRCNDLIKLITELPRFQQEVHGRITAGYAAFFPDLNHGQVDALERLDAPREVLGSRQDLESIEAWLEGTYRTWKKEGEVQLGKRGLEVVDELLSRSVYVKPLLSVRLQDEEAIRLRLTMQQALILEHLAGRRRVAIFGGAGTGKTLLAMEHARHLAKAKQRVLLLCYNRALADHLKSVVSEEGIHPEQLHRFCEWWISVVKQKYGHNLLQKADENHPGKDRFTIQLPFALTLAIEEHEAPRFDAVIVDEGQDFQDDEWTAVDALVEGMNASLCIFHDPNQRLYRRSSYFPVVDERERFQLFRNCRNTMSIHEACYQFYEGPSIEGPAIEGTPISDLIGATLADQARAIAKEVRRLLAEEVRPEDMAILIMGSDAKKNAFYGALSRLELPGGLSWAKETHRQERTILMDTVARFKGLERAVIFLWLGSDVDMAVHREYLYVGMSRAKSHLFLIGTSNACRAAHAKALDIEAATG
jgi:hypothetical protein